MRERYHVGPLHSKLDVEVEVEAESPEEARDKARPALRAQGIPEHDPLVVKRERPIRGDSYGS